MSSVVIHRRFYNHKFAKVAEYKCFRIMDLAESFVLYGYVKRGSDLHEQLIVALAEEKAPSLIRPGSAG